MIVLVLAQSGTRTIGLTECIEMNNCESTKRWAEPYQRIVDEHKGAIDVDDAALSPLQVRYKRTQTQGHRHRLSEECIEQETVP